MSKELYIIVLHVPRLLILFFFFFFSRFFFCFFFFSFIGLGLKLGTFGTVVFVFKLILKILL